MLVRAVTVSLSHSFVPTYYCILYDKTIWIDRADVKTRAAFVAVAIYKSLDRYRSGMHRLALPGCMFGTSVPVGVCSTKRV